MLQDSWHITEGNYKQIGAYTVLNCCSGISNSWVKRLLNLEWTFSNTDTSWKNKTRIRLTDTFGMLINLSKFFLQNQSYFIVWNQKQMIFVLGVRE